MSATDHDIVIVGSRVAGAATALLMARAGLRVLAVDRARFPSDTLSSHQLQPPGVAALERWGLLDRVLATGLPPVRDVTFDVGEDIVLTGRVGALGGPGAMYSPRRTVLDALLVDAAREAGADVIEGFDVQELVWDGARVCGVRGRERGRSGGERTFTARLVVGADGKNSRIAAAVGAATEHHVPARAAGFYTYWQGLYLPAGSGRMYGRARRIVGVWPTHDGLVVTYVGLPLADLDAFRADPGRAVLDTFDALGDDLGERARAATRVEPVRGTSDLPGRIRTSAGPGWALAGDAGLVMDSITGQGMSHALADAERLTAAVVAGLGAPGGPDGELAGYQRDRDAARRPMYEMTADLAAFDPRPESDVLLRATAADQRTTDRFLAVLAGTESPATFFATRNVLRVLGWRGVVGAMSARRRVRARPASGPPPERVSS